MLSRTWPLDLALSCQSEPLFKHPELFQDPLKISYCIHIIQNYSPVMHLAASVEEAVFITDPPFTALILFAPINYNSTTLFYLALAA